MSIALVVALTTTSILPDPRSLGASRLKTRMMSVGSDSRQSNGHSSYPSISHNGRWIAFESTATNFVRVDKNGESFDVFVRDRRTGTTRLVSQSSIGEQGNRDTRYPDFSRDGRFIVFTSEADNLVPNDENDTSDIFVRDLLSNTTERVTVGFDGTEANGPSFFPRLSGDGRYVVFTSSASNLVPADTNRVMDAFVVDRQERTTERVSVTSEGLQVGARTDYAVISDDGSTVAFTSWAESLDPRYQDEWLDSQQVYVHDRLTRETELGAVNSEGDETDDQSLSPSLSRDGRFLVFSDDESLMSWGSGVQQVYWRDRAQGETRIVSVDPRGETPGADSMGGIVSGNGRWVVFASDAIDLFPRRRDDIESDVFVRDMWARWRVRKVSRPITGWRTNSTSNQMGASRGARFISFSSSSSRLVRGDTNEQEDVFVRGPFSW